MIPFTTDETEVGIAWREHLENLHNTDSNEVAIMNVCGFDGTRRNRYFGIERKLKNDNSLSIDGITD